MRPGRGMVLVLATHNAGKAAEFRRMFAGLGVTLVSARAFGLGEPEETAPDFAGNAAVKAGFVARATGLWALADDSGLCVDALGGGPGVATADWCRTGGGRDAGVGMARLREAVLAAGAGFPAPASFRCALCLTVPGGRAVRVEANLDGDIVWPPRGDGGHGFDPVFRPLGMTETFAEMVPAAKDRISHRRMAFDLLVQECFT